MFITLGLRKREKKDVRCQQSIGRYLILNKQVTLWWCVAQDSDMTIRKHRRADRHNHEYKVTINHSIINPCKKCHGSERKGNGENSDVWSLFPQVERIEFTFHDTAWWSYKRIDEIANLHINVSHSLCSKYKVIDC